VILVALRTSGLLLLLTAITLAAARLVFADEGGNRDDLLPLRREIKQLQSDQTAERRRMDQSEQLIKELESQLRQVESQNQKLSGAAQQLLSSDAKLKSETNERLQQFQAQLGTDASPGGFADAMSRYLGTHQFTFAGAAAGSFIYDRDTSHNTFSLLFEPIAL
jgi:TolA-binding protein